MNLSEVVSTVQKAVRDNSPAILTAIGVSGSVGTAYLAWRAGWKSSDRLEVYPPGNFVDGKFQKKELTKREKFDLVWDLYIPPVASGVITVAAIVGANHISSKRMAAAYSVLAVTEKTLSEYREHVAEQLGEKKEKLLHDDLIQKKINENPPGQLVIAGAGTVLCCELFTGRYFMSDMETLRKAQNDINAKAIAHRWATLNDFYWLVGLQVTSNSGDIGWTSDALLDLDFTTVMSDDSRPCLAFEYTNLNPL